MRRILAYFAAAAALCAALCRPVLASEPSELYYNLIGRADTAISVADWKEAELCLIEAIAAEPQSPVNTLLLSNLGLVQYNLGRDSVALATLTRAHDTWPRSVTILQNRAQVLAAMGRDSAAMADYEAVCRLDTTLIEPRFMHAMLAIGRGDTLTAEADCRRLLEMDARDMSVMQACASLRAFQKRWAEALPYYDGLIDESPTADLYAARAICLLELNRLNEASSDITSGLRLDPGNADLYFARAHLNKRRYLPDDARADLKRALGVSPPEPAPEAAKPRIDPKSDPIYDK